MDPSVLGGSGQGASEQSGAAADVAAAAQVAAQEDELAQSLAALSRLSSARLSLEDLLTQVATFAVRAIPGADGAGLTLIEADRADTIVKSAPFVREVDDIQYGLGEGPCISAAATGQTDAVRVARWGPSVAAVRGPGRSVGGAQRAVVAADQCRSGGRCDECVRARQGRVR